jgi:hypothetical protein
MGTTAAAETHYPTKDPKLPSSNITNILPRMERLGGPYGMYATVYGVSTMVIHMAHPTPIQYILLDDKGSTTTQDSVAKEGGTFEECGASLTGMIQRRLSQSMSIPDSIRRTSSSKEPAYNHFKNFSGEGVFTSDGTLWKEKRISVLHCLIRGMYDPVNSNTTMTKLELEANRAAESFILQTGCKYHCCEGEKGYNGIGRLNIVPILQRSTIGLIYRYITHHNVDMYPPKDTCIPSAGDNKVQSSLHTLLQEKDMQPYQLLDTYLQAVTDIRMIILAQSRSFWFLLPRWVYRWFSPMYQQEERTMQPIRAFARLTCHHATSESPLGMLRQRPSHNPMLHTHNTSQGTMSKEMLDEAITILFAGQDTSAATLSWAIHLLSLYPDTQRRLYHEIKQVVESEFTDRKDKYLIPFTKKMISRMTFLDAVIKETMRLYPAAPFIVRRLQDDITMPTESSDSLSSTTTKTSHILLPKDSFACIWIYSVHRNPKLWNRPHDFLPERWIDSSLRDKDLGQRLSGGYIPFAAGPRNCLGQPLAHTILRIMLAKIIYNCEIVDPRVVERINEKSVEAAERSDVQHVERNCGLRQDMQAGFTILPLGGVHVQVHPRH